MTRALIVVAAAPAALVAALELGVLVATAVGDHPLWRSEALNLSEAAALRDAAEMVRLIVRGDDPNLARPVRAGFLDSMSREVTPLSAVTYSNRPELVELLMTHGATLDAPTWTRLHCYARQNGRADVAGALEAWRPAEAGRECSGGERPW
jgi:hypothetical protein